MNHLVANAQTFVQQVYLPDVLAIASFYRDWFHYGEGLGNFMAYGDYTTGSVKDPAGFFFPRGIVLGRDLSTVHPLDQKNVTEYVTHSWYEYAEGDQVGKHPSQGVTNPKYSEPKPPYEFLKTDEKYSWLKSPRYNDKAMEVGPLARTLGSLCLRASAGKANGGQHSGETQPAALCAIFHYGPHRSPRSRSRHYGGTPVRLGGAAGQQYGAWQCADSPREKNGIPIRGRKNCQGFGFHEAPRGALGHWIEIENKKIVNYQAVVPSTWNAGPSRSARPARSL